MMIDVPIRLNWIISPVCGIFSHSKHMQLNAKERVVVRVMRTELFLILCKGFIHPMPRKIAQISDQKGLLWTWWKTFVGELPLAIGILGSTSRINPVGQNTSGRSSPRNQVVVVRVCWHNIPRHGGCQWTGSTVGFSRRQRGFVSCLLADAARLS